MVEKLSIRSDNAALLLMDFQRMVVDSYADPEVHRFLMKEIFPAQAKVATVEQCIVAIP